MVKCPTYIVLIKEPVLTEETDSNTTYLWTDMCSGSIIDSKRVLTAAHCFEYENFSYVRDPQSLRIVAGNQIYLVSRTDYVNEDEDYFTTQWRTISTITIHPHYYFPINDIALLEVDTPFLLNGEVWYIQPAKRASNNSHECLSAGYVMPIQRYMNVTKPENVTVEVPTATVSQISVVSSPRCSELWEMNMSTFVCTDTVVKNMTNLDIGGPLVCTNL